MPRNVSGTYSTPAGQPVVSGTVISAATQNTLVSDIATEMTDSLSRSGKGGMTAALRAVDGTVAAPAISFTNESGTGWWRNAAGDLRAAVLGVARAIFNSAGHLFRSAVADGASAVAHTLDTTTTLANATAKLISIQNGGVEKSYFDKDGQLQGGLTRPSLPAIGQQVSSSCGGAYSNGTAVYSDVTNLSITITTTGRPVLLSIQPDGSANPSQLFIGNAGVTTAIQGEFQILRGASVIGIYHLSANGASSTGMGLGVTPPASMMDPIGAGTYTYKVQAKGLTGTTIYFQYLVFVAYEL